MAQLVVRNLEDDVKARLVSRARRHGRSMEEEVRDILRDAVKDDEFGDAKLGIGSRLAAGFEELGVDFEIPELRETARPAKFDAD